MQRGFPSSMNFGPDTEETVEGEETASTGTVANPNGWTGTSNMILLRYLAF